MFENNTEKKFFIATIFIMATLGAIYLFLINLKLAIAFLIFIGICFLAFLVLPTAANKHLAADGAPNNEQAEVDDKPNHEGENAEISAEGQLKTQAEFQEDLKVDDTPQDMAVSAEEAERMRAKLEEKSRNERAQEYMDGMLRLSDCSIDALGNPITSRAQGVENGCPVDDTNATDVSQDRSYWVEKMQSLPAINAFGAPISSKAPGTHSVNSTEATEVPQDKSYWVERIQSPPVNMNGFYEPISLDHPLSLLEIYTTTKSTDTGADTAAKMVVPDRISAWY